MKNNCPSDEVWANNGRVKENFAQVASQKRPIIIYVYSDICLGCLQFGPAMDNIAGKYSSYYIYIKHNATDTRYGSANQKLLGKFGFHPRTWYPVVKQYPGVILFNPKTGKTFEVPFDDLRTTATFENDLNNFLLN